MSITNTPNYPDYYLEFLNEYASTVESIRSELEQIPGIPHTLLNKVYYLNQRIEDEINHHLYTAFKSSTARNY